MFKNYEILLMKGRGGAIRNIRLRGWLSLILVVVFIGMVGANIWLWSNYQQAQTLEYELEQARQEIVQQDTRLEALTRQLEKFTGDLQRVQQFDTKLRIIMNIDKETELKELDTSSMQSSALIEGMRNPYLLGYHRELFARRMNRLVDDLMDSTHLEEVAQQSLLLYLRDNKDILLSTPSIWPAKGYLTSGFAWRTSPITGKSQFHKGIDIANKIGTPVWAPAKGIVTFTGIDGGYGLCIVVDHGNGISTRYAHLQKIVVSAKQQVQRGDVIGAIGNSGRSTGPHLHYEVHVDGVPVDPMRYILN